MEVKVPEQGAWTLQVGQPPGAAEKLAAAGRAVIANGAPYSVLRAAVCSGGFTLSVTKTTIALMRSRNALQDASLVAPYGPDGKVRDRETPEWQKRISELKQMLGGCDAHPPTDPEGYLRIRDYLFRLP